METLRKSTEAIFRARVQRLYGPPDVSDPRHESGPRAGGPAKSGPGPGPAASLAGSEARSPNRAFFKNLRPRGGLQRKPLG
jgi:hypothetical protein